MFNTRCVTERRAVHMHAYSSATVPLYVVTIVKIYVYDFQFDNKSKTWTIVLVDGFAKIFPEGVALTKLSCGGVPHLT